PAADVRHARLDRQSRGIPDARVVPHAGLAEHVVDAGQPGRAGQRAPERRARLLRVYERQRVVGVAHGVEVLEPDLDRVPVDATRQRVHPLRATAASAAAASSTRLAVIAMTPGMNRPRATTPSVTSAIPPTSAVNPAMSPIRAS